MKTIHSSYVFKQKSGHNLRTKANYQQVTSFNQAVTVLFYLHIRWRQVFLQFLNICTLSEHSKTKRTDNFKQPSNFSVLTAAVDALASSCHDRVIWTEISKSTALPTAEASYW